MLKLLSLFSGIGAFEKALSNLNIKYEVVNYCEIDKYASKSYCAIHTENEDKNLWDITKVNEKELPDFGVMTYGFPCQPYSVAGNRQGVYDTKRGNLFFEAMRIAKYKKPEFMIAENVKGLLSIHKGLFFKEILFMLNDIGYNNYYKVLNAKDYGIPQNRGRIFIVSIRKDIDDLNFEFPHKIKLNTLLKDILEKLVDEKFYISDKIKQHIFNKLKYNSFALDIAQCQTARQYSSWNGHYVIDGSFKNRDIREYKQYSPTIRLNVKSQLHIIESKNIRRLTPKECFRLMGFSDEDYYKCKNVGISDSQLYKQCGNSIVVNILEAIFYKLFINRQSEVNKLF